MWMNEMEVEDAERRWRDHPVLGPASYTLASLMAGVNRCSDGWPYWRAPARAATQLSELITAHERWERSEYHRPREGAEATRDGLRKAYAQLRRFRTKFPQCQFRIKATDGVRGDPEPVMIPSQPVPVRVVVDDHGRAGVLVLWPEGTEPAPGVYEGTVEAVVRTKSGRTLTGADLDQLAAGAGS